jgi:pimeloyl-ACP methyl ester carboxylesterase
VSDLVFHEFGEKNNPPVMLLHGGGLSWWMWKAQIEALKAKYFVIAPVIDGHGEAAETPFESIEKCANEAADYVVANAGGKLFALCGLSLGSQVAVEMLSQNGGIAEEAIIESALVIAQERMSKSVSAAARVSYPLIKKRWFAKLQAAQLKIPDEMSEDYFADSAAMSRESLIKMLQENTAYSLPDSFNRTQADILVLYGGKERRCMKESAKLIASSAPHAVIRELSGYAHGEMTLNHPQEYIDIILEFFRNR